MRRRMRSPLVVVLAAVATVAIGISVSPAVGGPSFLTLREAKQAFFTKKATKRLFLQKNAARDLLTEAQADRRYLPLDGATTLQVSPTNWTVTAGGGSVVDHYSGEAHLRATGGGTLFFNSALTIPASLQGRPVSIDGFELCYDATDAGVTLDGVFLYKSTPTSANVNPGGTVPIDDETDRHDASCRGYARATPVPVGPNDIAQVVIRANYDAAAGAIRISRLTLNLST
jgi:hypothetical protein